MSEFLEYLGYSFLRAIGRALPYVWADAVGMAVGRFLFSAFGVRRRVSMENLRHAFPEKPETELRRIARDALGNYGRTMMLFFWSSARDASAINAHLHLVNGHHATDAAALGRGLIILSGHFGAWELFPNAFATQLNLPMTIIVHTQRNARVDAVVVRDRNRFGNRIVTMEQAPREVLAVLRSGGSLGLLGDQSGPKESLFVEFFGRPCATYRGPAVFSLRQRSPIVMPMMLRRPDRGYDVVIEPIDMSDLSGPTEENIRILTERHTALLERYVRAHPDQWLWAHKRWKHTEHFLQQQRASRPQADARAS
jgi:Kdo2-lipid IVA lauroyltransferase/acyltransferase